MSAGARSPRSHKSNSISPDKGDNAPSLFGHARTVNPQSDSDQTFELATKWFTNCIANHAACQPSRALARPKRIIDLGCPTLNDQIRLIKFPTRPDPYAALSYTWGSGNSFKTEMQTLPQRQVNIPWLSLPNGSQDTISICRKLGLRYLWIDALCIVQDDRTDWQQESAKMADVYEGAAVTISVAWASDCTESYFHHRYYWDAHTGKQTGLVGDDVESIEYQGSAICVCQAFEHETVSPKVQNESPLYHRAWALQERLFSPRILQYTRSELCWECRPCMECECGGINAHNISSRNRDERIDRGERFEEMLLAARSALPQLLRRVLDQDQMTLYPGPLRYDFTASFKPWRDIVDAYSQRHITFKTDKLPAFSGTASRFTISELGYYYAGLWEVGLPMNLIWAQFQRGGKRPPPAERVKHAYSAPSWSWASVQGRALVGYAFNELDCFVEAVVEDVNCIPAGPDRFGEVQAGASLTLRAPVIRARLGGWHDLGFQWHDREKGAVLHDIDPYVGGWVGTARIDGEDGFADQLTLYYDVAASSLPQLQDPSNAPDGDGRAVFVFTSSGMTDPGPEIAPKECLLAIITSRHDDVLGLSSADMRERISASIGIHALILVASIRGAQGVYERIGEVYFECAKDESASLELSDFVRVENVTVI